jgi:phosphoribosylformylglycinamidine (FGAM) synthase PurS component
LLGFESVSDIRQGKYFEIALSNGVTQENARAEATRLAHEVLSNPIIEDFGGDRSSWSARLDALSLGGGEYEE